MDVQPDENSIERDVACGSCGEMCRFNDQWSHTLQCDEWKPKQCSNPKCTKLCEQLSECSKCYNAWYCGATCQQQHWNDHKPSCQKVIQDIIETSAKLKVRFQYRSGTGSRFVFPYYFGNSLAIDMLNLPANELCSKDARTANTPEQDPLYRRYSILSAGCSNLRNWIHTVASLPNEFKGSMYTVLNDFDPCVQARNVLQLYMMIVYSDDPQVAEIITTIWYSLHLPEEDYKFLIACLTALLALSSDDLGKVTAGVLQLTEADMSPLRRIWKAWLELECQKGHTDYIDLQEQRQRLLNETQEGMKLYREGLPNELQPSFEEFEKSGNFIPCADVRSRSLPYDNPTLTGYILPSKATAEEVLQILASGRVVYCIDSHLTPFNEWDYLKVKRNHYNKSMVAMFHSFISDQIKLTMASIKAGSQRMSIVIWNCLDLLAHPNVESHRFDRIFNGNIVDFTGTHALLKAMKPLLNRENKWSTIITQYWNWYSLRPHASTSTLREDHMPSRALPAVHDYSNTRLRNNPLMMMEEGKKVMTGSYYFQQEYFSSLSWFVSFLRAEYLAVNEGLESAKPPTFQQVKQREGLQLRDFRRGNFNKVVPFRYRRNVRLGVNMMRGMDRLLEWHFA